MLTVRLRELTELLHHRYALRLDTDDADLLLLPIARLLFRIHADKGKIASDRDLIRELLGWCWSGCATDRQRHGERHRHRGYGAA